MAACSRVRDNPEHVAAMDEHGIGAIDLVVVNLYPFEATVATRRGPRRDHREYRHRRPVDGPLGGQEPCLCRDRHRSGRLCRAARPSSTRNGGDRPRLPRKRLAAKAFALTAAYDSMISQLVRLRRPAAALSRRRCDRRAASCRCRCATARIRTSRRRSTCPSGPHGARHRPGRAGPGQGAQLQ